MQYSATPLSETEKKLLLPGAIVLTAFIIGSIRCAYCLNHWYCAFLPFLTYYTSETIARWVKYRAFMPPGYYAIKKHFRPRNRGSESITKPATQPTPEPEQLKLLSSIADWSVKDMIQCRGFKNYSSIGTGTPAQVRTAYLGLMLQFADARKDEKTVTYIKLMPKYLALELRICSLASFVEILRREYTADQISVLGDDHISALNKSAAKGIRIYYPKYEYVKETLAHDMGWIVTGEIATRRKRDEIVKEMESLDVGGGPDKEITGEQFYINIVSRIAEISKHQGVRYDINMSVLEYAVHESRLSAYIEQLKFPSNG